MRRIWLYGVAGTLVLALLMQIVNNVFEAAGSVPDLGNCAFLAGSLPALMLVYPCLAGMVASRLGRKALRGCPFVENAVRFGAAVGGLGALLYFLLGLEYLIRRGQSDSITAALGVWLTAYILLCVTGGALGALTSIRAVRPVFLNDSGG